MKNNRIKERGITLIALVITIIVLLLLAGISISMLAGNNSILNRAGESRVANALGSAKDNVNIAVMAAVQDYYQSIYDGQNVSTTYTSSGLDEYIVTNVKKNNTENNEYNLSVTDVSFGNWNGTGTGASITLVYTPDSSQITGTLSNGVMTWGAIENAGQITPKPITSIGAISPANPEVGEGKEITLTATINSDATESLTWTIEPTTVATITPVGKNSVKVTGITGQVGNTATITASYGTLTSQTTTISVVAAPQEALSTQSYVGYYAEVDGVWGIIYADLLMQKPDSSLSPWGNSYGAWSFPSGTSTNPDDYKSYTVSSTIPSGKTTMPNSGYTTTGVITPVTGATGADRFRIIEVSNRGSTVDWATAKDMKAGTNNTWKLPTKQEWSMFGSAFNVNNGNYRQKGLTYYCWSATASGDTFAYYAYFREPMMTEDIKTGLHYVRLCTTF